MQKPTRLVDADCGGWVQMNDEFRAKVSARFLDHADKLAKGLAVPPVDMSERWFHAIFGEAITQDLSESLVRHTTVEPTLKKLEGWGLAVIVARDASAAEGRVYVIRRDQVADFVRQHTGRTLTNLPDNLADLGWIGAAKKGH